MTESTRKWVRGILATVINGFASGAVLIIAAPETFNLAAGARKLVMTAAAFAVMGLANFLKQHPLPDDDMTVKEYRS